MIIPLTSLGPNYDTALSQHEQAPETAKAVAQLMGKPFDQARSSSEYCGRRSWPAPGQSADLLRWPLKVWATDTAVLTLTTRFYSDAAAPDCMAETNQTLTITPLSI